MKFLRKLKRQLPLLLIASIFIVYAIFDCTKINYSDLLKADTLNVYKNNELIATSDNPKDMFEIIDNETVWVYSTNASHLGISRLNMTVLYKLEFIKDSKIISNIKVLSPKTEEDVRKINELNKSAHWFRLNSNYVILYEDFRYFALSGRTFFVKLGQLLNQT